MWPQLWCSSFGLQRRPATWQFFTKKKPFLRILHFFHRNCILRSFLSCILLILHFLSFTFLSWNAPSFLNCLDIFFVAVVVGRTEGNVVSCARDLYRRYFWIWDSMILESLYNNHTLTWIIRIPLPLLDFDHPWQSMFSNHRLFWWHAITSVLDNL